MILRDRRSTLYDLASLFRGRRNTLDRWSGKIGKGTTTTAPPNTTITTTTTNNNNNNITLHDNYNYKYTTLHYTTLITLQYTATTNTNTTTLHKTTLDSLHYTTTTTATTITTALHCTALHYNYSYSTLHDTSLDYTTLYHTAVHNTTVHYIALHQLHHITPYYILHHSTPQTTTATTLHYTTATPLHYTTTTTTTALHHTTSSIGVRWPLQPSQPLQKTQLQPPFGPSVDSLCHPWFTTTKLSCRFPIFELVYHKVMWSIYNLS